MTPSERKAIEGPLEDRRVTEKDAAIIAAHLVDRLIERLSDEQTVQAIASVWAKQLDQHIGRTVRRGVWLLLVSIAVVVAVKSDAILAWFRTGN